jgi:hypothetical protein
LITVKLSKIVPYYSNIFSCHLEFMEITECNTR